MGREIRVMNLTKIVIFGILLWVICFLAGFFVWPLHQSHFLLFKSIMIVCSTLIGVILLVYIYKNFKTDFIKVGVTIGILWFVINILLDLIVLVGVLKNPIGEYFIGTGLRYLNIPIISIGIGWILSKKIEMD